MKPLCRISIVFVLLTTACNADKAAEEQENPDSLEIVVVPEEDTVLIDTLAKPGEQAPEAPSAEAPAKASPQREPDRVPQQEKPINRQSDKTAEPAQAVSGLTEGDYQLTMVQGERLPLVLDMTTECETKLMSGTLSLKEGRFQFQSLSAEDCEGLSSKQQVHEAAGSYRLEDKRLFLTVSSGEVLGDAVGVVEGNTIRLQQISSDEEMQEVDRVFKLQ